MPTEDNFDKAALSDMQDAACEAAKAAGAIALSGFRGVLEIRSKGGTDIVTQYDNAAERAALDILKGRYPTHAFLAEESGKSGEQAHENPMWMVDPIDGTHNYANQLPFWCVSVAVASPAGEILACAVYDPLHDELFTAARGGGATLNGKPIQCTAKSRIEQAIVAYDIGHDPLISAHMVDLIAWVQPRVGKVRHLGSAALSLTYVAAGRIDAYYHLSLQPWDIAAALLLIQEAGGTVTDWHGAMRLSGKGSAVASGKALHPALLSLLHEGGKT
ncbi:MAG TPA: inositol monophosphatase family protein [Chloroflexia bacterium]|nr:inositol monophosphatase family protein [Chloroflexia bacterium]